MAASIIELICDDLKYQDKQNDPQYLMLNTKLQEEKRINKKKKAMARKNKNGKKSHEKHVRGKSKFSNKYSERIASIREADEKARIKTEKENVRRKVNRMYDGDGDERTKTIKPKSARGRGRRMKTKAELREEMMKTLNESGYKKK